MMMSKTIKLILNNRTTRSISRPTITLAIIALVGIGWVTPARALWDFTAPQSRNNQPGKTFSYALTLRETAQPECIASPVVLTLDQVMKVDGGVSTPTTKVHLTTPPDLPASINTTCNYPETPPCSPVAKQVGIAIDGDAPLGGYSLKFKGVRSGTGACNQTNYTTYTLTVEEADFYARRRNEWTTVVGSSPGNYYDDLIIFDRPVNDVLDYTGDISVVLDSVARINPAGPDPGTITGSASSITWPANVFHAIEGWTVGQKSGVVEIAWSALTPPGQYSITFKVTGILPIPRVHTFNITLDTRDTTAPTLSAITCIPANNRITVNWNTNEPANGTLYYGLLSPPGSVQLEDPAGYRLAHSVTTPSTLLSGTNYYYQVKSCDNASPPNCSLKLPNPAGTCTTIDPMPLLTDPLCSTDNGLSFTLCSETGIGDKVSHVQADCTASGADISNVAFTLTDPSSVKRYENQQVTTPNGSTYSLNYPVVLNIPGQWKLSAVCRDTAGNAVTSEAQWGVGAWPFSSKQKLSIYDGVFQVSRSSGDTLEIGNAGRDIASNGNIYLRPNNSLAGLVWEGFLGGSSQRLHFPLGKNGQPAILAIGTGTLNAETGANGIAGKFESSTAGGAGVSGDVLSCGPAGACGAGAFVGGSEIGLGAESTGSAIPAVSAENQSSPGPARLNNSGYFGGKVTVSGNLMSIKGEFPACNWLNIGNGDTICPNNGYISGFDENGTGQDKILCCDT